MWSECTVDQQSNFRAYIRNEELLKQVKSYAGMNFLVDDLHPVPGMNDTKKQMNRLDCLARLVTEQDDCANIIITGESMMDMGTVSCLDRALQVRIPQLVSEELARKKEKINILEKDLMPEVARYFQRSIMDNYDDVTADMKGFISKSMDSYLADSDHSLRTADHIRYIILTEYLFRKYCCNGNEELSGKKCLIDALRRNQRLQEQELREQRAEDNRDYVMDLYDILHSNGEYIRIETDIRKYCYECDSICFYQKNRFYFSSEALKACFFRYLKKTVDAAVVINCLKKSGILEKDKYNIQKKLQGKWHYVVSKPLLELYCSAKNREQRI